MYKFSGYFSSYFLYVQCTSEPRFPQVPPLWKHVDCLRWAAENEERKDQIRAQRAAISIEAVRRGWFDDKCNLKLGKKRQADAVRRADEDEEHLEDRLGKKRAVYPNPDVLSFLEDAENEERQDQIWAQRALFEQDEALRLVRLLVEDRLAKKRAGEAVRLGKKRADEDDEHLEDRLGKKNRFNTWLAIPMFPSFNPDVLSFLEDADVFADADSA